MTLHRRTRRPVRCGAEKNARDGVPRDRANRSGRKAQEPRLEGRRRYAHVRVLVLQILPPLRQRREDSRRRAHQVRGDGGHQGGARAHVQVRAEEPLADAGVPRLLLRRMLRDLEDEGEAGLAAHPRHRR